MLQYDDSAFYFFALSILSLYLIPSWYSIASRMYSAITVKDASIGAVSRTSAEQRKAERLKRESKGLHALLKQKSFLLQLGISILLSVAAIGLMISVSNNGEVMSFDPFTILEIDSGADSKSIKKAYRRLSLLYHPDKNPGDRAAEAKFMMLSKAYEALTDEEAKKNWELYGNPDGKQSSEVSFGLPSFLLDSNYKNFVLLGYLIIMVVIVPFCVWTYYSDSSKYGEKDVMYDTYAWFHHALSEHAVMKTLPETLSGAAEFRKRNIPRSKEERDVALPALSRELRASMVKPKYTHPVILKGNLLLHTHLLRKSNNLLLQSHPALHDDLLFMLRRSTSLIDAMLSVCKHQDWIHAAITVIEFGQLMTQAMWGKDSTLLQIPHFDDAQVKRAITTRNYHHRRSDNHNSTTNSKNKKKHNSTINSEAAATSAAAATTTTTMTIPEFRSLSDDVQTEVLSPFTDTQKKDVYNFLDTLFPDVVLETRVFVDDDEDTTIYENDLVTIEVTLIRNNVREGGEAGLVHAPIFPFPKQEAWWVILGQLKGGKTISIDKVTSSARKVVHNIKFLAPPKGEYEFDLLVKSNGYVGCDQATKVKMSVLDGSTLPEYKVHPEDAALDDEPTLWEEMLNAHVERDSDDEGEGDDADDDPDEIEKNGDKNEDGDATAVNKGSSTTVMTAAEKKKEQMRKARQAAYNDDDDDDDDSDDE